MTTPNKQAELEKEILNRCAQEEGYVNYEELEILHQDCPKATKIYRKALTEGIKEGRIQAISEFKEQLKANWRIKARKMEIMSGEVAIYELENVLEKTEEIK